MRLAFPYGLSLPCLYRPFIPLPRGRFGDSRKHRAYHSSPLLGHHATGLLVSSILKSRWRLPCYIPSYNPDGAFLLQHRHPSSELVLRFCKSGYDNLACEDSSRKSRKGFSGVHWFSPRIKLPGSVCSLSSIKLGRTFISVIDLTNGTMELFCYGAAVVWV